MALLATLRSAVASSVRDLSQNPARTLLTLCQLVLATLALAVTLSAASVGLERDAFSLAEVRRFNLAAEYRDQRGDTLVEITSPLPLFSPAESQSLLELSPSVEGLALYQDIFSPPRLVVDGKTFELRAAAAVSPEHFMVEDLTLLAGSFFTETDAGQEQPVLVISDEVAAALFGAEDPINREVGVLSPRFFGEQPVPQTFRVIGVFRDEDTAAVDAGSFDLPPVYFPYWNDGQSRSSALSVLAKPGQGNEARSQVVSAARIVSKDVPADVLEAALEGIVGEENRSASYDFRIIEANDEPLALRILTVLFGLFSLVALFIVQLSIVSMTRVRVLEKRREIGIKRALGASRNTLVLEFIVDSAGVGLLGGTLGSLVAALFIIPSIGENIAEALTFTAPLFLLTILLVAAASALATILPVTRLLGGFPLATLRRQL
ncbi:MAG: ABC transporter permease [Truepera sp.]|nr:ABC transporter permease [Truepera sp.]